MSVKYELFKLAVKASGVKKRTSRAPEDLVRISREKQAKNPFSLPADDEEFQYTDHPANGFHCVCIHPRGVTADCAIMYAYGGGMMMPPAARYLQYAKHMARLLQCDVWFPRYPLCSDASVLDAVNIIYGVWSEMATRYDPERIAFYGFSSGASLQLSALLYNADQPQPLHSPAVFIGIAPGGCPADAQEEARMRELDAGDIEVSASFMGSMRELMAQGRDDVPRYMIDGTGGTWSALPPTHLYYGAKEVLSAKAPAFERALQEAGVPHTVTVRENMCHCYCINPLFPEAQQDYDAIVDLLGEALGCPSGEGRNDSESVTPKHLTDNGMHDHADEAHGHPAAKALKRVKNGTRNSKGHKGNTGKKRQSGAAFWDRTAFAYDLAMRKADAGVAQAAAFAASYLEPTDIVLDAATGTGAFACAIAPNVAFVAGCDLSANMLARARVKARKLGLVNTGFATGDITAIDFDDSLFDAAIAGNVLHLLPDPQAAVDELMRVVKPGGFIVVPNYFVDGKPADERFVKTAVAAGFPLNNEWSREQFLAFLGQAGLELVEERTFAGARPLCVAVTQNRIQNG